MSSSPLPRTGSLDFDLDALATVAEVADQRPDDCAPNWKIPTRIPTQRLSGLKRRGYLDSENGYWWLTGAGVHRLNQLRELKEAHGASR